MAKTANWMRTWIRTSGLLRTTKKTDWDYFLNTTLTASARPALPATLSCITTTTFHPSVPFDQYSLTQFPETAPVTLKSDRRDERGSQSGSDDGSTYNVYNDPQKSDGDQDDDAALTSQSLNADGTPKRPMNAFMIFARRRRPQVSAENQSMRTGEISKILSKEWSSMSPNDKQFYLDQAKQLKETFNSKYPDYVYRRRPNNSRKRRKTDGSGMRAPDGSLPPDAGDDMGGDLGEPSPSDGDDSQADPLDMGSYSRMNHPLALRNSPIAMAVSRMNACTTQYLHRVCHNQGHLPSQYPYLQRHGSGHYNNDGSSTWETSSNRSSGSGWFGPPHDRSATSPISTKSQSFPPLSSPSSWPSPNSPGPGASPSSSTSNSYSFPTLNSPFFPTQAQLSNYPAASSPTTTNGSTNSSQYQLPAPEGGRGFDHHRSYTPSSGGGNAYPSSHNSSRHSAAAAGLPRALPPVTSLPNSQFLHHNGSSGATIPPVSAIDAGYWNRERILDA
ncbi:uncharacterized protein EV420DRAFT_1748212 [Desarmillaria tabescens]|uniref:HMG box domain-containing protein n=1 Tax=Armillaria tabescens TaxID=1929756 RepID=A0AA39KED5_ARMTA|nr:uncharacterized protein EV420DRAFT_1748212 [Desarmillaria tabescens]KAK0458259.1 hypothetical protein EV420DRAFT_1748212 [Desarmillaria tabescens]